MEFQFEETPITFRADDGSMIRAGWFDGSFEIDEIGMIQTITVNDLDGNGYYALKRWKKGDKAPGFRARLFDALERTLSKKFEDEIEECLAELRGVPAISQRDLDRAHYHRSVL